MRSLHRNATIAPGKLPMWTIEVMFDKRLAFWDALR